MIFFVLDHQYNKSNLSFSGLKGQDSFLAQLLLKCQFLDVHLATMVQYVSQEDLSDAIERSFKIDHWINSKNTLVEFKDLGRHYESQMIGDTSKLLEPVFAPDEEKEGYSEVHRWYNHTVLVAWPKHESTSIY